MWIVQAPLLILACYLYAKRWNAHSSQNETIAIQTSLSLDTGFNSTGSTWIGSSNKPTTDYWRSKGFAGTAAVGLVNLGNTCYMNSILQCLFSMKAYRDEVISTPFKAHSVGEELKALFLEMQESNASVSCSRLAHSLGINPRIQEDAEEFLLQLVNRVDDSVAEVVADSFQPNGCRAPSHIIKFASHQEIRCLYVEHVSKKRQTNVDLSLDMRGCSSLQEALTNHFRPELLSGDSRYRTKDQGLQDAHKSASLASLPDVLCVHLKRFAFDPDTFEMRKIVTPLDVPVSLDLSKFYHNTSKDPNENKFIDAAASIQNLQPSEKDDNDLSYTLSAVVVHQGALDYGHYYSLCRSSASDVTGWVRLNDHIVSEVTESSVLLEARGSVVNNADTVSASSNAYILFYVRNAK